MVFLRPQKICANYIHATFLPKLSMMIYTHEHQAGVNNSGDVCPYNMIMSNIIF